MLSSSRISASGKTCCSDAGLRQRPREPFRLRGSSRRSGSGTCWSASRRASPAAKGNAWPWARALLASPEILLMDEPLASLDTERKLEILPLIESLSDNLRIPIVYVSHAIEEVARLASRVVVLDNGHVVAAGTVEDVLGPGLSGTGLSRFARSSVVTGRLAAVDAAYDLTEISHPAGTIWLTGRGGPIGRQARVVVRATDIKLAKTSRQNL